MEGEEPGQWVVANNGHRVWRTDAAILATAKSFKAAGHPYWETSKNVKLDFLRTKGFDVIDVCDRWRVIWKK